MIDSSRPLVELIFDKGAVPDYTVSACNNWPSDMEVPKIDATDYSKKFSLGLYVKLDTKMTCLVSVVSFHSGATYEMKIICIPNACWA
jgi:hypothetical protein